MKNIFNKDNYKLLLILLVLVIGAILIIVLMNTDKDDDGPITDYNDEIANVIPSEVEKLYRIITNNTCNVNYGFDFTDTNSIKVEDMDDEIILTIIFNNLKENNILNSKFSKEEYITYASNILGTNIDIPNDFSNFNYDGNVYKIENNNIIKDTSICQNEVNYKSVLYSYSYNSNDLSVYVNYIMIKDNIAYNLDGSIIGNYSKEKEESIMNSATSYVYNFKKNINGYYLTEVSKALVEINK